MGGGAGRGTEGAGACSRPNRPSGVLSPALVEGEVLVHADEPQDTRLLAGLDLDLEGPPLAGAELVAAGVQGREGEGAVAVGDGDGERAGHERERVRTSFSARGRSPTTTPTTGAPPSLAGPASLHVTGCRGQGEHRGLRLGGCARELDPPARRARRGGEHLLAARAAHLEPSRAVRHRAGQGSVAQRHEDLAERSRRAVRVLESQPRGPAGFRREGFEDPAASRSPGIRSPGQLDDSELDLLDEARLEAGRRAAADQRGVGGDEDPAALHLRQSEFPAEVDGEGEVERRWGGRSLRHALGTLLLGSHEGDAGRAQEVLGHAHSDVRVRLVAGSHRDRQARCEAQRRLLEREGTDGCRAVGGQGLDGLEGDLLEGRHHGGEGPVDHAELDPGRGSRVHGHEIGHRATAGRTRERRRAEGSFLAHVEGAAAGRHLELPARPAEAARRAHGAVTEGLRPVIDERDVEHVVRCGAGDLDDEGARALENDGGGVLQGQHAGLRAHRSMGCVSSMRRAP